MRKALDELTDYFIEALDVILEMMMVGFLGLGIGVYAMWNWLAQPVNTYSEFTLIQMFAADLIITATGGYCAGGVYRWIVEGSKFTYDYRKRTPDTDGNELRELVAKHGLHKIVLMGAGVVSLMVGAAYISILFLFIFVKALQGLAG